MFTKITPFAFLSAAVLAAPAPVELDERGLGSSAHCLAQNSIVNALARDAKATAFCASYISVPAVTSTVTAQGVAQTVTALATSTVVSTTTGAGATSTCAPQYANGNFKRDLLSDSPDKGDTTSSSKAISTSAATKSSKAASTSAFATPSYLSGLSAAVISADCACISLPTPTATITVTPTKAPVTVTSTINATSVVTAQPSATASQLYDLSGTYNAAGNHIFQLYPNLDFPGNDAFQGTCGVSGNLLTTSDGTFKCESWNDCMDICSTASWGCTGVSFVPSWNFCYLKSAVPGNGVANCGTVQPEVVESALNIAQGNSYAVSS